MVAENNAELDELRHKLKVLLIENLALEDITPEEISDDEILFGEGLGLDSLDAVEIVVLLQRNFGLEIKDMNEGRKIFANLETLTRYVFDNKQE